MKILVYIFLIYLNFCTSNFIHHGSKFPVTYYPKKVKPGMLQYLEGTVFKQKPTEDHLGIRYTAWPTKFTPNKNIQRYFPPFETSAEEPTQKRRVKKVLQQYSVFGPKRSKRSVDPKDKDKAVDGPPKVGAAKPLAAKGPKPTTLKAKPAPIAKTGNQTRRKSALRNNVTNKKKKNVKRRRKVVRRGKNGYQRRARLRATNPKKNHQRKRKNQPVKKTKRARLRSRFIKNQSAKEGYKQMKTMRKGNGTRVLKKQGPGNGNITDARRLIAARDASIENFVYVVSIQKDGEHWCAGAILNPRLVITTANCLWKGRQQSRLRVRAGSRYTDRGGQLAYVQEIMKHPGWRLRSGPDYDVALMSLDRKILFSHSLHGVSVPNRLMLPAFDDAWVASWGAERRDGIYDGKTSTLQMYHARIMDRNKCNNITKRFGVAVTENFICMAQTGRQAPCTRDTGAPAVSDGVIWGLASWGIRKLCGTERYPAMFSYLASEGNMDFIANATRFLMSDDRPYPYLDKGPREIGPPIDRDVALV